MSSLSYVFNYSQRKMKLDSSINNQHITGQINKALESQSNSNKLLLLPLSELEYSLSYYS